MVTSFCHSRPDPGLHQRLIKEMFHIPLPGSSIIQSAQSLWIYWPLLLVLFLFPQQNFLLFHNRRGVNREYFNLVCSFHYFSCVTMKLTESIDLWCGYINVMIWTHNSLKPVISTEFLLCSDLQVLVLFILTLKQSPSQPYLYLLLFVIPSYSHLTGYPTPLHTPHETLSPSKLYNFHRKSRIDCSINL